MTQSQKVIQPSASDRGYTLLELTIVIFLMGLFLALSVPRFQDAVLFDDLKSATRRMVGTIKTVRDRAVRDQRDYKLHFDLGAHRFWVEWDGMSELERSEAREQSSEFPGGVRVMDISFPNKQTDTTGDAVVRFTKKGYAEPAVIHLKTGEDSVWTIVISPFLRKIKTYDRYVEIQDV